MSQLYTEASTPAICNGVVSQMQINDRVASRSLASEQRKTRLLVVLALGTGLATSAAGSNKTSLLTSGSVAGPVKSAKYSVFSIF